MIESYKQVNVDDFEVPRGFEISSAMSVSNNIINRVEREEGLTIYEQNGIKSVKEVLVKLRNKFYHCQRIAKQKNLPFTVNKAADEHIAKVLYRLTHRVISGTIHYNLF